MKYYVIINGESSLDIQGLVISKLPDISKPLMRNEKIEIDGRDGDIITKLGYSAYDKTIEIGLWGTYDINTIIEYFNQDGVITFSNEIDKYYNFSILNREDFINKLEKFKTASITLHCQPFKYEVNEETKEIENEYVERTGTSISLSNTLSAPMEIDLKGNTQQEQLSGKNLFKNNPITITHDGITMINDGTNISFSGNNTSDHYPSFTFYANGNVVDDNWWVGTPNIKSENGYFTDGQANYILSLFKDGNIITANNIICYIGRETTVDSFIITNGTDNYTKTINSNSEKINFISIGFRNQQKVDLSFKIQLEKGSTATSYEQYCGGIPSPNPDYPQDVNVVSGNNNVVVCGNNLLPFTNQDFTLNNVRYYAQNGNLYLDGTSTGETGSTNSSFKTNFSFYLPAGTYILNSKKLDANQPMYIRNYATNETLAMINGNTIRTATFTLTETTQCYFSFYVYQKVFDNMNLEMQLELGNQATTYEAYNGTTYNIDLPVKNLFDKDNANVLNAYFNLVSGYNKININYSTRTIYIPCKANTTYTISKISSARFYVGYTNELPAENVIVYGIDGDTEGYTSHTITTGANAKYLCAFIYHSSYDTTITIQQILDSIQIEYGSKVNNYTPYGTTPIELCKIGTYQDYFYKDSGKWYLHKEVGKAILDGTENWNISNTGTSHWYYICNIASKLLSINFAPFQKMFYSNQYINTEVTNVNTIIGFNLLSSATITNIRIREVSEDTVDNFKTRISSNNIIVYGPLKTPTNTEITDTTLKGQLEAIASATSYEGETNINQANNDLPFIITASIFTGTDTITIENKGNTTAKPTMTIYGKGTIGVYLNGNQVFTINLGDEEYITIDTQNMEASKDTILKNRLVVGDYNSFVLQTGNNTLKFTGLVEKVEINNYSRWV